MWHTCKRQLANTVWGHRPPWGSPPPLAPLVELCRLHCASVVTRRKGSSPGSGAVHSCPSSGPGARALSVQQENAIQTMELRNCFSLYCLHQEMQLVHTYLPLTSHILGAFVNAQIPGHKEVGPLPEGLPPLAAATEDCLAELADWGECRALKQLPLS